MREAKDRLDQFDARVVAVGAREDYQAQKLIDDGMPFPLLMDPENQVRTRLGAVERFSPLRLLSPKGAVAYAKSLRRAKWFSLSMSEATQRPAIAVLDAQLNVTWTRIGNQLGDYPSIDEVCTELQRAY